MHFHVSRWEGSRHVLSLYLLCWTGSLSRGDVRKGTWSSAFPWRSKCDINRWVVKARDPFGVNPFLTAQSIVAYDWLMPLLFPRPTWTHGPLLRPMPHGFCEGLGEGVCKGNAECIVWFDSM